jgi:hypothetical protein
MMWKNERGRRRKDGRRRDEGMESGGMEEEG